MRKREEQAFALAEANSAIFVPVSLLDNFLSSSAMGDSYKLKTQVASCSNLDDFKYFTPPISPPNVRT